VQIERVLLFLMRAALILGALVMSGVQISGVAATQSSKDSKMKAKAAPKAQPTSVCESPTVKVPLSSQTVLSSHTVTLSWRTKRFLTWLWYSQRLLSVQKPEAR
jgi:hypothetical protein